MTRRVKAIAVTTACGGEVRSKVWALWPVVRALHTPRPRTNELSTPPARAGVSSQLERPVLLPGGFQGKLKRERQMSRCSPRLHPRRGGRWPGRRDGDAGHCRCAGGARSRTCQARPGVGYHGLLSFGFRQPAGSERVGGEILQRGLGEQYLLNLEPFAPASSQFCSIF